MSKEALALAKEIGEHFGEFWQSEDTGKFLIDNGDKVFVYDSIEELLLDWEATLVEADAATGGTDWKDVIAYIQTIK